jgi:hypothetical protein
VPAERPLAHEARAILAEQAQAQLVRRQMILAWNAQGIQGVAA